MTSRAAGGCAWRVTAHPRLHLGLIDVGYSTPRLYGGFGVSLNEPRTVVSASSARAFEIASSVPLGRRTESDLYHLFERFLGEHGGRPVLLTIHRLPPQHVGLGSKTALLMATARLLSAAANVRMSEDELVAATGRGGTSGIGVNAFFRGGWIADAGHRREPHEIVGPSSRRRARARPPVVFRHSVTPDWRFHLILPPGRRWSAKTEADFFRRNSPISASSARGTLETIYQGAVPAIVEGDLPAFGQSLARLQQVGFKAYEIAEQSPNVRRCLRLLHDAGVAAGMSSMGPLVFAVTSNDREATGRVREIADRCGSTYLARTSGRNRGARLEVISDG